MDTRFGGTFVPDDEPDAFEPIITIGVRNGHPGPCYRLDISAATEQGLELHIAFGNKADIALDALCALAPALVRMDMMAMEGAPALIDDIRAVGRFVQDWRTQIKCNGVALGALADVPYEDA